MSILENWQPATREQVESAKHDAPCYPIRFCTGGCAGGVDHHAHTYNVDPVDGQLATTYLCPGNLGEAKEIMERNPVTGEWESSFIGYIAREN